MRLFCALAALLLGFSPVAAAELQIEAGERLLVIAPHPDDETLAAGGLIQRVLANGGSARVILVTAGDGYDAAVQAETGEPSPAPARYIAYGASRFRETQAALHALGGERIGIDLLGFPDGELQSLLQSHWSRGNPALSPTTSCERPPYPEAVDGVLRYTGLDLRNELFERLEAIQPTIVALPDWLDEHPDHSASATFALLALEEWRRARGQGHDPRLLAYLIHWHGWPERPRGWAGRIAPVAAETIPLLPPHDLPQRELAHATLTLSEGEIATKRAALSQFVSQQRVNPYQMGIFVRRSEWFVVVTSTDLPRLQNAIRRPPAARAPSRG